MESQSSLSHSERLSRKITEYKGLQLAKQNLEKRLEELNAQIKRDLAIDDLRVDSRTFRYSDHSVEAEVKVKNIISYDKDFLEALCISKQLDVFKTVLDEDKVEQAYLLGELTDSDMREVRTSKKILALKVTDVQADS